MTLDEGIKLVETVTELLKVIIWPFTLFLIFLSLRQKLRDILSSLSEFSLKAGGIETSLKRTQLEIAADLGGAAAERKQEPNTDAIYALTNKITQKVAKKARHSLILWVDDLIEHHAWEQRSFERLQIRVLPAKSTEEALLVLENHEIDVIISDMNRDSNHRAGTDLLQEVTSRDHRVPVIIYDGSNDAVETNNLIRLGAFGHTNRPDRLIELVLEALSSKNERRLLS